MNQLKIDLNSFSYKTDRKTFCHAKSPAERFGYYAKMPLPRFLIKNLGNIMVHTFLTPYLILLILSRNYKLNPKIFWNDFLLLYDKVHGG